MIIFVSLGTFAFALLAIILLGAIAAEWAISHFLIPLMWLLCIAYLVIGVWLVYYSISGQNGKSDKTYIRIISGIVNGISYVTRNSLCLILLICVLKGYLMNINEGSFIWAIFALLSDIIVAIASICFSLGIDYAAVKGPERVPTLAVTIFNLVFSIIIVFVLQILLKEYYMGVVESLFPNAPWLVKLVTNEWLDEWIRAIL